MDTFGNPRLTYQVDNHLRMTAIVGLNEARSLKDILGVLNSLCSTSLRSAQHENMETRKCPAVSIIVASRNEEMKCLSTDIVLLKD